MSRQPKHKRRLLEYLEEHGTITTQQAIDLLGNTRLSEYIRQLRKQGYKIENRPETGINRYMETTHYVTYVLKGYEGTEEEKGA